MATATHARSEAVEQLRELVDDIDIAMLITSDESTGGASRGRPMSTQQVEDDGTLWFFTARNTGKVDEIRDDQHVAVSYADPKAQTYVYVTGTAHVVDDRAKAEELWNPIAKAWFDGPDDPELVLLHVHPEQAEYWDAPHGRIAQAIALGKRIVTGDNARDLGDTGRLALD
jgi:general stress protein 26